MSKPAMSLILILTVAGCASMKEKMSQMKDKTSSAAAQSEKNMHEAAVNHDPAHPLSGSQKNGTGGNAGVASEGGGQAAAGAAGGAAVAGSSDSGAGSGSGADSSGGSGSGSSAGGDATAAGSGDGGAGAGSSGGTVDVSHDSNITGGRAEYNPADCVTPTNKPEDVEKEGTERWGWTDAKVGWLVKVRQMGGLEMSQEALESREKSFLLETKLVQNGSLLSCSRSWTARLNPKYEPVKDENGKELEYEQKTTDLADETVTISGKSYTCKVKKTWTKVANNESTATSWTCEEIPGWLVKSVMETPQGPQTVYELIELRM